MADLSGVSTEDLIRDYEDCVIDLRLCELALAVGVKSYEGEAKSVRERLNGNEKMINVIRKELSSRNVFTY